MRSGISGKSSRLLRERHPQRDVSYKKQSKNPQRPDVAGRWGRTTRTGNDYVESNSYLFS